MGSDLAQGRKQLQPVIVNRTQADTIEQVGKCAQHHVPVLDDIADARWRACVVLEDHQGAVLVTDEISATDVDIRPVWQVETLHDRTVVGVTEHEIGWNNAISEDFLLMVDIVEQEVERRDSLDYPLLNV